MNESGRCLAAIGKEKGKKRGLKVVMKEERERQKRNKEGKGGSRYQALAGAKVRC